MGCNCSIDINLTNLVLLVLLILGVKKLVKFYKKWKLEKMLEKYEHTPRDKVILHTIPRGKTMPCISPFGLKLETYLRMAKIPYEIETKDYLGPKGKLPWISYNGTHLGDSHLIIQFLNRKFGINFNKNFSTEQLALARACRIVLEDHLFWGGVYYRFIENGSSLSQLIKLPTILKVLLPLRSAQLRKRLEDLGIGKHTPTEIYEMTGEDVRTVSSILGNKKFICGDEPCEEDCAIFGFVAQGLWGLPGSSFEKMANSDEMANLRQYCERMKQLCWPDWADCIYKS